MLRAPSHRGCGVFGVPSCPVEPERAAFAQVGTIASANGLVYGLAKFFGAVHPWPLIDITATRTPPGTLPYRVSYVNHTRKEDSIQGDVYLSHMQWFSIHCIQGGDGLSSPSAPTGALRPARAAQRPRVRARPRRVWPALGGDGLREGPPRARNLLGGASWDVGMCHCGFYGPI
jgi:hypothetical protein